MQVMRERLEATEQDLVTQKTVYEQQLLTLTERLNDIDTAHLRKLTDKLHKLDHTEDGVDEEQLELTEIGQQEIANRDKIIQRLTIDVERLEDENHQFEQLISDKNKEIDELNWQVLQHCSVDLPDTR